MLRYYFCKFFHRNWVFMPVRGWRSSLAMECLECGATFAHGRLRDDNVSLQEVWDNA